MTVYAIVGINITDSGAYAEYVDKATKSFTSDDVKVAAACGTPVLIEGKSPYSRYVVLECKDRAAFDKWYNSSAYQQALPIRHRTAETGFFILVDGV